MASEWQRREGGYLRADGEWFLVRGARMSDSNGTAWLIHRRVEEDRIGRDALSCYDRNTGSVLWRVSDGYPETADPDFDGPLYAHDWDAGSLAEAKHTVSVVENAEVH